MIHQEKKHTIELHDDLSQADIEFQLRDVKPAAPFLRLASDEKASLEVKRSRCFFEIGLSSERSQFGFRLAPGGNVANSLAELLHVPALRGNPERTYRTSAIGPRFPGAFTQYIASIIQHWKTRKDKRLSLLGHHLKRLGLTWKVDTRQVDDTRVEVRVGRLPQGRRGGARDMVSIADVGFGVSQTLPVLVALLCAKQGEVVYVEQPEIHLHPRAQVGLAELLVDAANRGVKVIVETHSSMLLLGIQELVATGTIKHSKVALNWFSREPQGTTIVDKAIPSKAGTFGAWPVDFGDVELDIHKRYLDAAENALAR